MESSKFISQDGDPVTSMNFQKDWMLGPLRPIQRGPQIREMHWDTNKSGPSTRCRAMDGEHWRITNIQTEHIPVMQLINTVIICNDTEN